jgi:hypothetical protein
MIGNLSTLFPRLYSNLRKQTACLVTNVSKVARAPELLRMHGCISTGLLWQVAFETLIVKNIAAVARIDSIKQLRDLSLIFFGFNKVEELISLNFAEMFLVYGRPRLEAKSI